MNLITVVAKIKAKQGAEEKVREELLKLIAPTLLEEGCIDYDLHQDYTDASLFFFYEKWESEFHLEKHLQSHHIDACFETLDGLVDQLEVNRLTKIR
ncbi:MAG: antibiotic biosynthesis monooxygenase [Candidatus Brocadiaceae bacterium]|nr:antibiotic biosynthesis monooxygenase [Candidatus Brocadiaceae bacterium]